MVRYDTTMKLESIVPWGRNLDEYTRMFALSDADLSRKIVDVGGGPASFAAELTAQGGHVVAIDPLYAFEREAIRQRIRETFHTVVEHARQTHGQFNWTHPVNPREMGKIRMAAMRRFLKDYDAGQAAGRYVTGSLPELPVEDDAFDLALCSHLLFTYSHLLDLDAHLAAVCEMLRVAREVRIFPLLDLEANPSPHLPLSRQHLADTGAKSEIVHVDYEFQIGGNQMLTITRDG